MKKRRLGVFLALIVLILPGCRYYNPPASSLRLVTQIDVTCQYGQAQLNRRYTASDKMELVLLYLRLLQRGSATDTDPEQLSGIHYKIVLHYADGKQRIYHQQSDRYLSENFKPWVQIDPEYAQKLMWLLLETPSDSL